MHIAIDARIINTSTGRYVERLIHYLEKIDTSNQYSILVPTKDKDFYTPVSPNFTVRTVDFANYSLAEQIGFKKYLDDLKPDLVHFCMPQQPVFYKGAHITTFHDLTLLKTYNSDKNWLVFHIKQLIGRFVFKRVARTSRHIITPTEYTKKELVTFATIDPAKVTVTYEAADTLHDDTAIPYKHPFKEFILYVGQHADYKNLRRLMDAHQQLLQKHPDLGLIFAGRLTEAAKRNQVYATEKGYKNVLFTGFVEDAQRDWLFKNCRVYVFASLMEGFGLPGLEAMCYGAPVASSNATCLPEVYGNSVHYFDPTNTDDMARAINDILTNPQLRAELIEKGHKQVKKYSWQRMAEQTHKVYLDSL